VKEYSDPDRLVTLQVATEEALLEVPSEEGTIWYGFTFGSPTVRVRFPAASLRHLVTDEVLAFIVKAMNDPDEVSVEWLRHIILREAKCECMYDRGCCDESPFYCKEWQAHRDMIDADGRLARARARAEEARRHFEHQQQEWGPLLP